MKGNEKQYEQINKELNNFVNSALSRYNIKEGQKINMSHLFKDKILIYHMIKEGLPYTLFEQIKTRCPLTEKEWAEYLEISVKTLQRNKAEQGFKFKSIPTEKILELVEIIQCGLETFNTKELLYKWLQSKSYALGNLKPIDLIKNSYGKEIVLDELHKIEHGVFA